MVAAQPTAAALSGGSLSEVVAPIAAATASPAVSLFGGVLKLVATVLNAFGANTNSPTAPANPLAALSWRAFRQFQTLVGIKPPVAGTASSAPPDPNSGVVKGDLNVSANGQILTYTVTTQAGQGTATVNSAGRFAYIPTAQARYNATESTTDTFTVTVSNGFASVMETVTVSVLPKADIPVAGTPTVGAPNATTGVVTGALHITDPGGKTLMYTVSTTPGSGAVTVDATGSFTYTPTVHARLNATESTTDMFTVTATNGTNSITEQVTVAVLPLDAVPVAGTPIVGTPDPVTGRVTGMAVFTDPAGETLTYSINMSGPPAEGYVTVDTATGAFTYIPASTATPGSTDHVYILATNTSGNVGGQIITVPVPAVPIPSSDAPTVAGTIALGTEALAVAFSPDGARAYVTTTDYVGDRNVPVSGALKVIDTATNTVIDSTPVGTVPGAVAVTPNGAYVYVANYGYYTGSGTVSVVDTVTGTVVADIAVGGNPVSIAVNPDGRSVYVTNYDWAAPSGIVQVIDTATNAVTTTVTVSDLGVGGVAVSPSGAIAYAGVYNNGEDAKLVAIDTATNTVTSTVGLPVYANASSVRISPDGDHVYAGGNSSVSVVNTATGTVAAMFTVPDSVLGQGLTLSPDGSHLYVTGGGSGSGSMSVIDTATNVLTSTISVDGSYPYGVAVSPDGTYAYVVNLGDIVSDGSVSVISLSGAPSAA